MKKTYNVASGQTSQTCWFHSILNMMIMTDEGLKVLWKKLQEIYPTFTYEQKKFFHSASYLSCPYKSFHPISFWKYINLYICAFKKAPPPNAFMNKNEQLLEHLELSNNGINEKHKKNLQNVKLGEVGFYSGSAVKPILKHIGFVDSDYTVISSFEAISTCTTDSVFKVNNKYKPDLAMDKIEVIMFSGKYKLSGAILLLMDKGIDQVHALACVKQNGKGYIIDSNYPTQKIPLKWWDVDELDKFKNTYKKVFTQYPKARIHNRVIMFDVLFYTHPRVKEITPYCSRKYNITNVMPPSFLKKEILEYYNTPGESLNNKKMQNYILKNIQWKYNNNSQRLEQKILNTFKILKNKVNKNNMRMIIERKNKNNFLENFIKRLEQNNKNKIIEQSQTNKVKNFIKRLESNKTKTRKNLLLNVIKKQKVLNNNAPYGRNKKGRVIHKGPRGGLYVIGPSGKKLYRFPV